VEINGAVILIHDISGRLVRNIRVDSHEQKIFRSNLSKGEYMLELRLSDNSVWKGRFNVI
jgi:hypothetical protein